MKRKKILSLILVLGMIFSMTACGKTPETDTKAPSSTVVKTGPYANLDTSKAVTIKMYALGDVPADMQKVQDEANKKYFKPLLNCTVELNFLSWSDYMTKYDLLLAGGDQCDLIYTAGWCYYNQEAAKGAFKELSTDWITKNMPQTIKSQAAESWEQISVGGKIYAVPQNNVNFAGYKYISVREDLRIKYKLPKITDVATLEQYLFTVAEKEKGIQGIAAAAGNPEFRHIVLEQQEKLTSINSSYDFMYKMDNKTTAPASSEMFYLYTSDYFKQFAEKMATWNAKGVWSKNAINNTVSVNDSFAQGKGASIAWNGSVFTYGKQLDASKIGTASYFDLTPELKIKGSSYANDAIAITSSSKNPERSGMALDLMKNNKDLNNLLVGGIKDVHYTLDASGKRAVGPDAAKYGWDGWSWGMRMATPIEASDTDPRQVAFDENFKSRLVKTDIDGFTFDEAAIKAELAVVNSIRDEYLASFELGAFGAKTDAKFNEFKTKIDKAGLKKVQDEFSKQYDAYVASHK